MVVGPPLVMDDRALTSLLDGVRLGRVSLDAALAALRALPYQDLGEARLDHHRALRLGAPEVVLGESKSAEQLARIARALIAATGAALLTRVQPEKGARLVELVPELRYLEAARVAVCRPEPIDYRPHAPVLVVTAGTSDQPVAEEALETLASLRLCAERLYDVGVAGLHRLLSETARLQAAPALIVVAGMEGALPGVVAGLVAAPVVAVPTSVGYGAALGGFTTLFAMLSGCAAGVTVVNIDNGFGAAMAVHRLFLAAERERRPDAPPAVEARS